jgi:membrane-associated phospholipid phosphatase
VASPGDGVRTPVAVNTAGSCEGDVGLTGRRRHRPWILPLGIIALFVLFTIAVHLRWLDGLDIAVYDAVRPGDVWGPAQTRAGRVVIALQPGHLTPPLLVVVAALCLRRGSLRPGGVLACVSVPVVIVTLGTKWAMSHWESSTAPVPHGSFPSGHMVVAITAFGVLVLLLRPGTRWGWLLPALVGCVMGSALVLASVHPATDVIGAALLATAALTGATTATLGQWASDDQPGRRRQGVSPGSSRRRSAARVSRKVRPTPAEDGNQD